MARPAHYLKRYSNIRSAAGDETVMREAIRSDIRECTDSISVNPLGNLYAEKGGKSRDAYVLLSAHMDEVAFIVKSIEKNGLIKFYPVGGVVPKILPGTTMCIGKEKVPGVIGKRAVHLLSPKERKKLPEMKELSIDVGASSTPDAGPP